jgi:phosphatidylserine/phosphatidylglycerophosphate/cardiolipin synthase-like enzyme
MRKLAITLLSCVAVLSAASQVQAATGVEVHYSPAEPLDAIDVALINTATSTIDLAAYTLTNPAVVDALLAASQRGVALRIVVDPREPVNRTALGDLPLEVRTKHGGALMHLKGYVIDGAVLRTGSANFSYSGEHQQDNDLVIIHDEGIARQFDNQFERIWDAAQ